MFFSQDANWRTTIRNRLTSPHKTGPGDIPLLTIPGLRTDCITTDPMHCFHLGWGQDLGASGVVLLAKLGYFGNAGALDSRLNHAYGLFVAYCIHTGKTTSCDGFSKKAFDMTTAQQYSTGFVFCV